MGKRRLIAVWGWVALIVFVLMIGCGGSSNIIGGGSTVTPFVGDWNGMMVGADGSNTQIYVVIASSGAVTWSTYNGDPINPFPVTETGTILSTGNFTVNGSTPATAGVTIHGALTQSGHSLSGSATGCCAEDFLEGSGVMTSGSIQVQVTLNLSGFGSD